MSISIQSLAHYHIVAGVIDVHWHAVHAVVRDGAPPLSAPVPYIIGTTYYPPPHLFFTQLDLPRSLVKMCDACVCYARARVPEY